jgi:hypothetical protein
MADPAARRQGFGRGGPGADAAAGGATGGEAPPTAAARFASGAA